MAVFGWKLLALCASMAFATVTVTIDAFVPSHKHSFGTQYSLPKFDESLSHAKTSPRITPIPTSSPSTTRLYWGVLVPVPDDFFTVTGISLGFAYTILRSWNRVTVENVAWENRLEDARMTKLDNDEGGNLYTELELRKVDAAASKSAYGPDGTEARRETERERKRRSRVKTYDNYDDDDELNESENESSREDDRQFTMSDEQIAEFEETYGVGYDPYYDEPYTADELPDDISFVEDKVYGDRRYENGEIFYRDERKEDLYWRQGGRPRLKQFWELF